MTDLKNGNATLIADLVRAMAQATAQQYGLEFAPGPVSQTEGSVTVSLTFKVKGAAEVPLNFERDAANLGLPPGCYGREFLSNGRTFAIVGFKPRNWKYPVIAVAKSGKRYKFPKENVLQALL